MKSTQRDWEAIREKWDSDFRTVVDALTTAMKEEVSKETRKKVQRAIRVTSKHRDVVLEIIERAESTDRTLRGSDFAVEGRRR